MTDQIIEAWHTNNRMNLMLVGALNSRSLEARPIAKREGRNVRQQLMHMVNVCFGWMSVCAKEYVGRMKKLNREEKLTSAQLKKAFVESAGAIENFLRDACDGKSKLSGFRKSPVTFMAYLISHESHHRGQILLSLKQSGIPVDKKVQYGIWEWHK